MKKWQKALSIITVSILILFFTRSDLYNLMIKYDVDNNKPDIMEEMVVNKKAQKIDLRLNQTTKQSIDQYISEFNPNTNWEINDVLKLSLKITKQEVDFLSIGCFFKNKTCENNWNVVNEIDKTHCRGFSFYFTAVSNYILTTKHMTDWEAVSKVGELYFLNFNIHPLLSNLGHNKSFFIDHDFVCIQNKVDTICVDPTLYEFTCIKKIALKK